MQPPPPRPIPPSADAKARIDNVLFKLSEILNNQGGAVITLAEKYTVATQPDNLGDHPEYPPSPIKLREKITPITEQLEGLQNAIYRELIPGNNYYAEELRATLGPGNEQMVGSTPYETLQKALGYSGALATAMGVAQYAKNETAERFAVILTEDRRKTFSEAVGKLKAWIEACNSRIQERRKELQ
jgi:hypothetical protein